MYPPENVSALLISAAPPANFQFCFPFSLLFYHHYYQGHNYKNVLCVTSYVLVCVGWVGGICVCAHSPWYNRTGWLGYLLSVCTCTHACMSTFAHVCVCTCIHVGVHLAHAVCRSISVATVFQQECWYIVRCDMGFLFVCGSTVCPCMIIWCLCLLLRHYTLGALQISFINITIVLFRPKDWWCQLLYGHSSINVYHNSKKEVQISLSLSFLTSRWFKTNMRTAFATCQFLHFMLA